MTISVIPVLWCLSLTHYIYHWPHGDIWHNWKWNTKRSLDHPGTRKSRHGFPGCNSIQKTRLHHLLPHECASHLLTPYNGNLDAPCLYCYLYLSISIPVFRCLTFRWPHGEIWHNWNWNSKRNPNHPGKRKLRCGFPRATLQRRKKLHRLLPHERWKFIFWCSLYILLVVLDHNHPSFSMPHIMLTTWRGLTPLKLKFEEDPQPP